MTAIKKDPVFSAPLAWDDPDFEGKDVSLKDYNVLWHECVANEAIANLLFEEMSAEINREDVDYLESIASNAPTSEATS